MLSIHTPHNFNATCDEAVIPQQMTKHARKHTLAHTQKQPSVSLVWMGRACCFDVGLDGAGHLAYACWGKKWLSLVGEYFQSGRKRKKR